MYLTSIVHFKNPHLGPVGVEVDGGHGGGEGVHFPLVGGNLVLQGAEGL